MEPYSVEQLTKDLTEVAERQNKALERLIAAFAHLERQVSARNYLAEVKGGDK